MEDRVTRLAEKLLAIPELVALMIGAAFVCYVVIILVPFLRRRPQPTGDPAAFAWHFLVPCRDEEAVVGETVDYLRATFPQVHLWVVDDDSDDATPRIVLDKGAGDPLVHLVSRRRPNARLGKGDALNAGYRALDAWLGPDVDRHRQIVIVLDADGRPAPNFLEVCAGPSAFGDPGVGAVQVEVRMSNRDDPMPIPGAGRIRNAVGRVLVRVQDLEFRTAISAIQLSRRFTRSVGMGGNGQLTRVSVLDAVCSEPGRPWGGSLLEDFELGIHVLMAGYRNEYSADTWVEQEALYSFRRFVAQRTRWGQGTMQCMKYLPRLWSSPHVSALGALELFYYLIQPWLQLTGTVIYPVPVLLLAIELANPASEVRELFLDGGWKLLAYGFGLAIVPFAVWGPVYWRRCEPGIGLRRAVTTGLAYWLYMFLFYVTAWRGVYRIIRKRNDWAKTRRNAEGLEGVVAREA
jgi:cellulose synthase/poly-beta-1,6-N-acetylglucosamine synthase-like glycosyltransferase